MNAFGIDAQLSTVELGQVTLSDALDLARDRRSHAHEMFEHAEDCMAATRIGFARDGDNDFVEIDFTKDIIDVRYQRRGKGGFLGFKSLKSEMVSLDSMQRLETLLADYFNRDREGFDKVFQDLPGRKALR